jgi:hypothetical protein
VALVLVTVGAILVARILYRLVCRKIVPKAS